MFPEPGAPQPTRPLAVRIFMGPHGLRAGWRFAAFALIFIALLIAGSALLNGPLHRFIPAPAAGAVREGLGLVCVLAATWIMSRVDSRPFSSFGLDGADGPRNFVSGAAAGIAVLSLLMGALVLARAYRLTAPTLHGGDVLFWGSLMAVTFLFVGLFEELLTRGYPLFALAQGIGFWPAAVLLSILFGAGHLGNRGEEILGVCNAMLAGLVFSYSLRWSGSLWWAIGCHMTWDWGESFFYGVADSGSVAPHHFLAGRPAGASWVSGGSVGPEGSALCIPALLLLIAMVRLSTRGRAAPGLDRLRKPLIFSPSSLPSIPSTPPVLPPAERESDSDHPA
jgi:membrane protease YdiL (CAAX protease family)